MKCTSSVKLAAMATGMATAMAAGVSAFGQSVVPSIQVLSSGSIASASAGSDSGAANNTPFAGTAFAVWSSPAGQEPPISVSAGSGGYSHWDFGRLANASPNYSIGVAMQGSVTTTGGFAPGGAGGTAEVTFRLLAPHNVRLHGLFGESATGSGWLRLVDVQVNVAQGGLANGWTGISSLVNNGPTDAVWPAGLYTLYSRAVASNNAGSLGISGGQGQATAAGGVTVEFLGVVPAPGASGVLMLGGAAALRRRRRA
jgi:hypothetical protein